MQALCPHNAAASPCTRLRSNAAVVHHPMNAWRHTGPVAAPSRYFWDTRLPDHSKRGSYTACQAIKARWCLDARYGFKSEVTNLLVEWVQTIGAAAGLNATDVQLSSGAIGCPESRLELEVTLDSLTDWEMFLSRIPAQQHKAWSQRMQGMVLDGSPTWHVYRVVPVTDSPEPPRTTGTARLLTAPPSAQPVATSWSADTAAGSSSSGSSSLFLPSSGMDAQGLDDLIKAQSGMSQGRESPQGPVQAADPPAAAGTWPTSGDDDDEGEVVLDWKGEPMRIRKGDRMPKFL